MPHKFIRACTALAMTWLALFSPHSAAAMRQPSSQASSAMTARHAAAAGAAVASAASCVSPYTVRKGDTLGAIAKRCGVSVAALKQMNGLRSDVIRIGQVLATRASGSKLGRKAPAPVPTPRIESPPSPW